MKYPRLFSALIVFLLISPLLYFFSLSPAKAATFNPSFSTTLSDNTPSLASNIQLRIIQPAGDELIKHTLVNIPSGWELTSGTSYADSVVLGEGTFTADFLFNGSQITAPFTIKNNLDLQGHKMHVVADFGNLAFDVYIDGNTATGHTIDIPVTGAQYALPSDLVFTLYGSPPDTGTNFILNPTIQGDYEWNANFTSMSDVTVVRSQTLSIPGTATPTGDDVTAEFDNGSSLTFSNVTAEGVTTIATSETIPPENTGQFQLAPGGLYYDFNTTAAYTCPCVITFPYDPITNPSPHIYHLNTTVTPVVWEDATISVDEVNQTITGVVSSLSWFAVGMPSYSLDWRLPLDRPNGHESVFSKRILILPIIFSLLDSDGQYVENDDVTVQVLNASGQVIDDFPPRYILRDGKFYIAMLKVRQLHLPTGEYTVKVKVGNTLVSPTIDFILR